MKRFFCLLTVVAAVLCLSSCGRQWYQDEENYFKIAFPKDMHVFVMDGLSEEDPEFENYGVNFDELSAFHKDEGGIFLAKSSDKQRECSVTVFGSTTTIGIWELKKSDSDMVIQVYKQLASSFNASGYAVVGKTEVEQGRGHYIFVELSTAGNDVIDMLYMTTVKNGLQYSIVYTAPEITDENRKEAEAIFDSAFITKTISQGDSNEARRNFVTTALIVIGILVVLSVILILVRMRSQKRKERDSARYHAQFEDDLK